MVHIPFPGCLVRSPVNADPLALEAFIMESLGKSEGLCAGNARRRSNKQLRGSGFEGQDAATGCLRNIIVFCEGREQPTYRISVAADRDVIMRQLSKAYVSKHLRCAVRPYERRRDCAPARTLTIGQGLIGQKEAGGSQCIMHLDPSRFVSWPISVTSISNGP